MDDLQGKILHPVSRFYRELWWLQTGMCIHVVIFFLFFDFIESYFLQSDFYPGLRKIPKMYPYSGNQVPLQNGGLWETLEIHKGISLL